MHLCHCLPFGLDFLEVFSFRFTFLSSQNRIHLRSRRKRCVSCKHQNAWATPKCLSHIVAAHTCKPYRYRHITIWKHTNMPILKARFYICLLRVGSFCLQRTYSFFMFIKTNVFIRCTYVLSSIYVFNCLHFVYFQLIAFNVVIVYFHLFLFNDI